MDFGSLKGFTLPDQRFARITVFRLLLNTGQMSTLPFQAA